MGKIAFVFPGQGAQTVGMGRELYEYSHGAKRIFDMAGNDIKKLAFEGEQEQLNLTINTQPCLYILGLACAAALKEKGVLAEGGAGFSLGEIPAVVHFGLLSHEQGLELVRFRAKIMQECNDINKGCMYAVLKLSHKKINEICTGLDEAYPVNYNCPGQITVACSLNSSASLCKAVAEHGGKAVKLAASGAFHSPHMDKAAEEMTLFLSELKLSTGKIPVYSNLTAEIYGNPKELLAKQINHPVLWQKTIENMIADGFDIFIETGAGKTLSQFIRRINSSVKVFNVCDPVSLENTVQKIG